MWVCKDGKGGGRYEERFASVCIISTLRLNIRLHEKSNRCLCYLRLIPYLIKILLSNTVGPPISVKFLTVYGCSWNCNQLLFYISIQHSNLLYSVQNFLEWPSSSEHLFKAPIYAVINYPTLNLMSASPAPSSNCQRSPMLNLM